MDCFFFDPEKVLKSLGLNSSAVDVADFGCGYGTFTLPAARIIAQLDYLLISSFTRCKISSLGLKAEATIS